MWTEQDQTRLVEMMRSLRIEDRWKFPTEVLRGYRDMTEKEAELYLELRNKWTPQKKREQVLLLKRLPPELQAKFSEEALRGERPFNQEESWRFHSLVDAGYFD